MRARRTIARCLPVLSASRVGVRPDRRCDRAGGPLPCLVPATPPSRRMPATRPRVRSKGPTYPPRIPAACCRIPGRCSFLAAHARPTNHADGPHSLARPDRKSSAIDGAATSSSRVLPGRTERGQPLHVRRRSDRSSSKRGSRRRDGRAPSSPAQRTARPALSALARYRLPSSRQSVDQRGTPRPATRRPTPPPVRVRPMKALLRALPPRSSAVESGGPAPSRRPPRARH